MIRIIKGTYGRVVDGTVVAMRKGSEPFSLSEERETQLVAAGVAEKVQEPEKKYTTDMKMAELREAAAALGVDASKAKTKKEVIAMLEEAEEKAEAVAETETEAEASAE